MHIVILVIWAIIMLAGYYSKPKKRKVCKSNTGVKSVKRDKYEELLPKYEYFIKRIVGCYKNGFTKADVLELLPNGRLVFENKVDPAPDQVWFFSNAYYYGNIKLTNNMEAKDNDWQYLFKVAENDKEIAEIERYIDFASSSYIHMGQYFRLIDIEPKGNCDGQELCIKDHPTEENGILKELWSMLDNPFNLFQVEEYLIGISTDGKSYFEHDYDKKRYDFYKKLQEMYKKSLIRDE